MKETYSGPLAAIKYLGRYTHRIAISNFRLISMDDKHVTFKVRDYKDGNKVKEEKLTGIEFIRRFLMHVLPKRFVKVRTYAILANINKKTKLELCRKLTSSPRYSPRFDGLGAVEILSKLLGRDITLCPSCGECQLKKKHAIKAGDTS